MSFLAGRRSTDRAALCNGRKWQIGLRCVVLLDVRDHPPGQSHHALSLPVPTIKLTACGEAVCCSMLRNAGADHCAPIFLRAGGSSALGLAT